MSLNPLRARISRLLWETHITTVSICDYIYEIRSKVTLLNGNSIHGRIWRQVIVCKDAPASNAPPNQPFKASFKLVLWMKPPSGNTQEAKHSKRQSFTWKRTLRARQIQRVTQINVGVCTHMCWFMCVCVCVKWQTTCGKPSKSLANQSLSNLMALHSKVRGLLEDK